MRNLLGLSWLVWLLCGVPALAAESTQNYMREAQEFRGARVAEIEFKGDELPESAQSRFRALRNRAFSPAEIRALLIWLHENGVDSLIDVSVQSSAGGVRLVVFSRQKSKIREVQFEGNASVSSNTLLPVISLKDGHDLDNEALGDSLQKISLFYSKQGYLATEVKHSFDPQTGVLKFHITEGEPTLLSRLDITPLTSVERKELRQRYEKEIRDIFGLKVGERIQRDRVLEGIQAVKDWLRDHDFLMARDPVLEYRVDENGQVGLFLNIQYGPRIRYGFRGNVQFSYRELTSLVGEVKEVASGSDYLAAVRRRVLEAYREIGFANAQITTLVREEPEKGIRYITLVVNEGTKIKVRKLTIEGVYSMTPAETQKKYKSLASRLVQRDYFDEAGFNRGGELFADYLKSQGYLSAKMEFAKFDFNQDRSRVDVFLLFNEGIQTRVADIKLTGIRSFTEPKILEMLSIKQGEPFDIFAFERGLIQLKERYGEIGNLSAQILNEGDELVKYSRDNSQVSIHIEVDEGPVFNVGDIIVRGNQQTHARVVLRELPFITNDVLTTSLLSEAEDNIRKLNLFSSVIVRPIDKPGVDNAKDILILVEESTPGSFDIVPGFRNDLGLRLGFEFGYQNIGGWNRSVNASAVFNRRTEDYRFPEYNFSLGFREPYLANWPVTFTSSLTLFKRQFVSFDADVNRATMGVKRDLTRYLSGLLEYSYEKIKIANIRNSAYQPEDARTSFIGSVTPGFIFDSRNDRFNPYKGLNSVNRFEVASQLFGSGAQVGYYRFTTFNSTYFRLFEDLVLALAMNVGWERSNILNQPIPIFKLFRLGGLGSIRGMTEDALEVETRKNINGILGFVNYRAELRIPLVGNVGTAVFLDAGNLMVDRFILSPGFLRSSAGTGLRYNTPVGPVVLDFAWRLQGNDTVGDTTIQNGGSDRFKVHFSIGAF